MVAEHLTLEDPSLFSQDFGSRAAFHGRENLFLKLLDAYTFLLEEFRVIKLSRLHGIQHVCKTWSRGKESLFRVVRKIGSYLYLFGDARAIFFKGWVKPGQSRSSRVIAGHVVCFIWSKQVISR